MKSAKEKSHAELLATALSDLQAVPYSLDQIFPVREDGKQAKAAERTVFWLPEDDAPRELRIFAQEFKANGVVHEMRSGTLGLIHFIPGTASDDEIRDRIGETAYLRHVIGQEHAEPTTGRPLFVEAVLVLLDWSTTIVRVGSILRGIMRESSILHMIGIGLLDVEKLRIPSTHKNLLERRAAMRRAFPWLLTAMRAWYGKQATERAPRDGVSKVERVILRNFRCPGERHWEFARGHSLHLVHGQNGSGKSTLCEAMELLVTGKIGRLESARGGNPADYVGTLTYQGNGSERGALELEAVLERGRSHSLTFGSSGATPPLADSFPADAFRLDENLSNRISRGSPGERAEIFLGALLADEGKSVRERRKAERDLEEIRGQLRLFEDGASRSSWVDFEFLTVKYALCLLGERLGALDMFFEGGDRFSSNAGERAAAAEFFRSSRTQEIWRNLRANAAAWHQALGSAIDFLHQVNNWKAARGGSRSTPEKVNRLVRRFEELTALCDLLEREAIVTATLANAKEKHKWSPESGLFCGLDERNSNKAKRQKEQLDLLRTQLQECRKEIETAEVATDGKTTSIAPDLSAKLRDDLTLVGRLCPAQGNASESSGEALGQLVEKALERSEPAPITLWGQEIIVGLPGQLDALLDRMRAVRDGLNELTVRSDLPTDLAKLAADIERLDLAEQNLRNLETKSVQEFQKMISEDLGWALNELTALMTPARWAYMDLIPDVRFQDKDANMQIGVRWPGAEEAVPAALTLNTAELNTMTLALFLLCGVQPRNPIRMLVLDDPFQNMDELTVTTVARGLARVMRIWGDREEMSDWRIILMLHGEDNIERVRAEAPCAVYFLPWLTPSRPPSDPSRIPSGDASVIECEKSRFPEKPVILTETFTLVDR